MIKKGDNNKMGKKSFFPLFSFIIILICLYCFFPKYIYQVGSQGYLNISKKASFYYVARTGVTYPAFIHRDINNEYYSFEFENNIVNKLHYYKDSKENIKIEYNEKEKKIIEDVNNIMVLLNNKTSYENNIKYTLSRLYLINNRIFINVIVNSNSNEKFTIYEYVNNELNEIVTSDKVIANFGLALDK